MTRRPLEFTQPAGNLNTGSRVLNVTQPLDSRQCDTSETQKPPAEWRNGRRYGLKIRWGATPVRVRLPPRPLIQTAWQGQAKSLPE